MRMSYEDENNVALYLSGDEAGLHALIHTYTKTVYGYIRHMVATKSDAEDLTQETFIKVWKHIKKYKQGQGFKTWQGADAIDGIVIINEVAEVHANLLLDAINRPNL
jgi:RNA polymerase sigma-70 factor (ECF subfamily)